MQAVRPPGAAAPRAPTQTQPTMQAQARAPVQEQTPAGPRRYGTIQMDAVVPLSAGRMLDDDLGFDFDIDADGALELDSSPPAHGPPRDTSGLVRRRTPNPMPRMTPSPMARLTPPPMARMAPGPMLPPPPPWPTASTQGRRSSSTIAAVDPHSALVAFAGFGDAPSTLWSTPAYALRVIVRRRALRADLARARLRRSHDVGLYEASLRTADDAAVRKGVLVAVLSALALVLLIVAAQVARGALPLPW